MTTAAAPATEPTQQTLAHMVRATMLVPGFGCVARLEATGDQCLRDALAGLLCSRHEKVARNRFAKSQAGKRRATYKDLTQTVTVTVADLADAMAGRFTHGVTVRLRSATIAHFELRGAQRTENGGTWLSIGHCLNNPALSGGTYGVVPGHYLVDVGTTVWAPEGLAANLQAKAVTADQKDLYLSDLNKETA